MLGHPSPYGQIYKIESSQRHVGISLMWALRCLSQIRSSCSIRCSSNRKCINVVRDGCSLFLIVLALGKMYIILA